VSRTDEQSLSPSQQNVADGRGRNDQPPALTTPADRPRAWSREDLQQRLERLPRGHPSSPYNADGTAKPPPPNLRAIELPLPDEESADGGMSDESNVRVAVPKTDLRERAGAPEQAGTDHLDVPASDLKLLSDTEHVEYTCNVREQLAHARDNGLPTDRKFFNPQEDSWTTERQVVHRDLVDGLYENAIGVPCEQKAVMAGGLPGAGKSTVLERYAGIDRSQYLTINPDDVKEEMAVRGLIPEVEGLSPMEASDLVHEESSHVAKLLAERALRDGKNIIWDITMSSRPSTERRLDDLDRAGYVTTGIFVDITIETSVRRADARHRHGHEEYRNDRGMGGRFVPSEVIRSQEDGEWGSKNRRTLEEIKERLADCVIYDNSADGHEPVMVTSGHRTTEFEEEG
jgi:predicted kinase